MVKSDMVKDFEEAEKRVYILTMVFMIGLFILIIGIALFLMRNPPYIRAHCIETSKYVKAWEPY